MSVMTTNTVSTKWRGCSELHGGRRLQHRICPQLACSSQVCAEGFCITQVSIILCHLRMVANNNIAFILILARWAAKLPDLYVCGVLLPPCRFNIVGLRSGVGVAAHAFSGRYGSLAIHMSQETTQALSLIATRYTRRGVLRFYPQALMDSILAANVALRRDWYQHLPFLCLRLNCLPCCLGIH